MGEKITIEPVTRIEGHAKVTIHLDDAGKVERAFFHVNEFRGFEKFTEGRPFYEMPQITERICGICPVSHHLASAKACDAVAGVTPPRPAVLLRELLHMGQIVQSHSMHFFELAGPDLLLGFDADPAIRNVVGVIQLDANLALKAVNLRKYGQEIIRTLGTKRVHPVFAIPGGVNAPLLPADRDAMLKPIDEMIASIQAGIAIAKGWFEKNAELVKTFAVFPSGYAGLVGPNGELEMYNGQMRIIDRNGQRLAQFDIRDYREHIGEHVEDWSYLKFPYYKNLGWPGGAYRVGPLGRLNVCDSIPTPLAQAEFKLFKQISGGKPVENTLYFHYARLIEAIYALERIRQLLEDPDICSTDILAPWSRVTGHGVGCIEAPRGTLIHEYWTDENGQLTRVNLIVATGHNNWAMSQSVESVAKAFVDGKNLSEGMLNRIEAAIRAHDPCLSCATHAVGQMPLEVIVYDPAGEEVNRIRRH